MELEAAVTSQYDEKPLAQRCTRLAFLDIETSKEGIQTQKGLGLAHPVLFSPASQMGQGQHICVFKVAVVVAVCLQGASPDHPLTRRDEEQKSPVWVGFALPAFSGSTTFQEHSRKRSHPQQRAWGAGGQVSAAACSSPITLTLGGASCTAPLHACCLLVPRRFVMCTCTRPHRLWTQPGSRGVQALVAAAPAAQAAHGAASSSWAAGCR